MFQADFLIMTGKTNIKLEEDNGSQLFFYISFGYICIIM